MSSSVAPMRNFTFTRAGQANFGAMSFSTTYLFPRTTKMSVPQGWSIRNTPGPERILSVIR